MSIKNNNSGQNSPSNISKIYSGLVDWFSFIIPKNKEIISKRQNDSKIFSKDYFEMTEMKNIKKNFKDSICDKHKKKFVSYCFDCNTHFCKKCIDSNIHTNHNISNINMLKPSEDELKLCEEIIKYKNDQIEIEKKKIDDLNKSFNNEKMNLKINHKEKNKIIENKNEEELALNNESYLKDIKDIKRK